MWFDVSMYDVVFVTVLKRQQDLSHIMAANSFAVDESSGSPLYDFKAEVCPGHEFENHVQHPLRTEK